MLSLLIFFPFIFGLTLFFYPQKFLYKGALSGSVLQFLIACSLFMFFDSSSPQLQLVENFQILPFLGISYFLGVDGLSFWYVLLSSFLLPLVVLSSSNQSNPFYFFLLFSLVTFSNGSFLSFDGFLFYIFFEMSLLPLFFMIFLWGGEKRIYASFKFIIYTFFASLFLLGGLISLLLMNKASIGEFSASLIDFYQLDFVFIQDHPFSTQALLFFCFAFAFAVKTPLVPFHTWLPLAHVEAPTGASVYLAAVLLKMGTYGWFRFILPLFPEASAYYSPLLLSLAVFGLIYASLMAFAQTDMKKLVAYSSISHMAYVLIGVFAFNIYGLQGAFYQTLTHGISSAALFLLVGLIYNRTGSRDIRKYGGLSKSMPYFSISFFLISLSAIALPLTGGFIAEFLVLLGSYMSGTFWVWLAILGVVLTAVYMLNMFQKVFLFEESKITKNLKDLNLNEFLYLTPLVLLVFLMGVLPNFFFKYSQASLNHLSENLYNYSLPLYKKEKKELSHLSIKELQSFQKIPRLLKQKTFQKMISHDKTEFKTSDRDSREQNFHSKNSVKDQASKKHKEQITRESDLFTTNTTNPLQVLEISSKEKNFFDQIQEKFPGEKNLKKQEKEL